MKLFFFGFYVTNKPAGMSKSDKRFFDPQNNAGHAHAITPLQRGDTQIRLRQFISSLTP